MLDSAVEFIKDLQKQVQVIEHDKSLSIKPNLLASIIYIYIYSFIDMKLVYHQTHLPRVYIFSVLFFVFRRHSRIRRRSAFVQININNTA